MGKLFKKMAILAAAVVAAFTAFFAPINVAQAEEASTTVSEVMADLQKDETFDVEAYPEKNLVEMRLAGEEYLQLIKIAESVNDQLYLYVYQPSDSTMELTATMVNLSQTTSDSAARIYPLKLVSTEGVFDKYLVDGLQVLDFEVRNYSITSLYRAWQKGVDSDTGNDNAESSIAHAVGQTWYARDAADGGIEYSYTYDDVIIITDEWHGEIDYKDGKTGVLESAYTTSHFIAFTTDHKIDKLKSAEITYDLEYFERELCHTCLYDYYKVHQRQDYGRQYLKIYATDIDQNNPSGFIPGKKYSWDKINTVDEFLTAEEDNLSVDARNELIRIKETGGDNGSFVLRFLSTSFKLSTSIHLTLFETHLTMCTKEYEVSDVAILRLTFETESVPYIMGVVDSMTSSDGVADGGNTNAGGALSGESNIFNKVEQAFRLVGLLIGVVALAFIVYFAVLGISWLVRFIREHPIKFKDEGDGGNTG